MFDFNYEFKHNTNTNELYSSIINDLYLLSVLQSFLEKG